MSERSEDRELRLDQALEEVATQGRQLVNRRIDLFALELKATLSEAGRRVFDVVLAMLLGFLGLILVTASLTLFVAEYLSWPSACLTVGSVYLLGAVGLMAFAGRAAASTTETR